MTIYMGTLQYVIYRSESYDFYGYLYLNIKAYYLLEIMISNYNTNKSFIIIFQYNKEVYIYNLNYTFIIYYQYVL